MLEIDDIAEVVATAVKEATAPLLARIDALEKWEAPVFDDTALVRRIDALEEREPLKGDPGEVDMDVVRSLVDEVTQQVVAEQLPEAVKAIPIPEAPAAPEPIAPDMDAIGDMIRKGIADAVAAIPPAKDGNSGVGLAGGVIDREGALVLTLSDGKTLNLGRVVGKDGDPGHTFTLDDFDIEPQADGRTLKFCFVRGDTMHSFELEFPIPIYRGIFKEAEPYDRGDMVTWAGSLWHLNEPKGLKPGAPDSGWQLAAKAGRPGKDGKA